MDIFSTKFVLNEIKSKLVAGTVILFDDFYGYPGWEENDNKALNEWASENKIDYKFIAFGKFEASIQITNT